MRRPRLVIVVCLTVLVAVGALAYFRNPTRLAFERAAADLPAAEAEARRLGLPLTGADLMPKTPVDPADNAAPLIRDAGRKMEALTKGHPIWSELSVRGLRGLSSESRSQMDAVLAECGPILDLAVQASEKPACDFERPWDTKSVWDILLPELEHSKRLTSALRIRGLWRTDKGDAKGAIRDFRAAFVLARYAGMDRDFFSTLTQLGIELSGIGAIERAATMRPRDTALLAQFDKLLAEVESVPVRDTKAFVPEVVNSLQLADTDPEEVTRYILDYRTSVSLIDRIHIYQYSTYLAPPVVPAKMRRDANRARALRFWSQYISGLSSDTSSLRVGNKVAPALESLDNSSDPTFRLLQHEVPATTSTHKILFRREANLRTVRALLAALIYRAEYGRYPTSLAELKCNSDDPFSLGKLGYRVNGEEVRVYSVGTDAFDNGGRLLSERRWFLPRGRDTISIYPFRPQFDN